MIKKQGIWMVSQTCFFFIYIYISPKIVDNRV